MKSELNFPGKFIDPEKVLRQLEILPGQLIADFGCGAGFFSLSAAKLVGEDGKVIALDILVQALESVASRAKLAGLQSVVTKRANLEKEGGSKLEDEFFDWVIMKDMLFQNKKKDAIIKEAFRVLKKGGKILVVEWKAEGEMGPEKKLRVDPKKLKKDVQVAGFAIGKDIEAGNFHYAFVAAK